ncbi:50S ribosomal protein L25 [Planctomycetales bacterium ZRK34]|nr:50S ribosomal protein L25 [Planctomycetales bacterium ZRK34]
MSHDRPKLKTAARERTGSKYAKRLRAAGQLPAVVYGHGQDPAHITLEAEQFVDCLHDGAHLVELEGKGETCLIKDVQYDYLGTSIIHVDLTRVDLSEEVEVSVPIVLKGEDRCPGAKAAGAILEQPIVDLEVICRADAIPDEIVLDVSELEVEQSITIADLKLPAGVRTERNAEDSVVSIYVAAEEPEEGEGEEEADSAEPEVISERKTEEESD